MDYEEQAAAKMIFDLAQSDDPRRTAAGTVEVVSAVIQALPKILSAAHKVIRCASECIHNARLTKKKGWIKLRCIWGCLGKDKVHLS